MQNNLYYSDLHYKLYYAYNYKSYITAKKEATARGWRLCFASERDGANGDTYIIYDDISNLPENLQKAAYYAELNNQKL